MNGIILNANIAHRRKVRVNPIPRHYEELGEKPYIKYNCPVCDAIGNTKISIPEGILYCPLCNVALNWDRKPEIGDTVVIRVSNPSEDKNKEGVFEVGTHCVVVEDHSDDRMYEYPYRLREKGKENGPKWFYPSEAFSILEREDA